MDISVALGKIICEIASEIKLFTIAGSACSTPSVAGTILITVFGVLIVGLAYRFWRVSAP